MRAEDVQGYNAHRHDARRAHETGRAHILQWPVLEGIKYIRIDLLARQRVPVTRQSGHAPLRINHSVYTGTCHTVLRGRAPLA